MKPVIDDTLLAHIRSQNPYAVEAYRQSIPFQLRPTLHDVAEAWEWAHKEEQLSEQEKRDIAAQSANTLAQGKTKRAPVLGTRRDNEIYAGAKDGWVYASIWNHKWVTILGCIIDGGVSYTAARELLESIAHLDRR
jgi:hypothetical protein